MNKCTLIGNLGKKPELRHVGDNQTVCQFSIATSETYKNKKGEKCTETTWHNLVVWGRLAEVCAQYLDKGSKIAVEGKIRNREYDKDGVKKYISEVVVSEMEMLGSKQVGDAGSDQGQSTPSSKSSVDTSWPTDTPAASERERDDLPF